MFGLSSSGFSLFTVIALAAMVGPVLVVLLLQFVGWLPRVPFNYNVRNLVVRWRTTLMTALAFTLVVGLMTVLLAFVNGMYKLTESSAIPANVVVLADGATDELFSNLGYGEIKEIELRPEVARDEEGKPLASWEVYVVVNQPIPKRICPVCSQRIPVDRFGELLLSHGSDGEVVEPSNANKCSGSGTYIKATRGRRFIQVRGIEDPVRSGKVHNLPLYPGGVWFNQAGVQALPGSKSGEQATQAVLGEGIARELGKDVGKPCLEPGDIFELGSRSWVVVGVMKSAGSTFDSEVWAKFSLMKDLFGKGTYTTCVMRTRDGEAAKELAKDLSANFKKPAVSATPEPAYYARLNTTNEQFLGAILAVVVIMGIGGVFGVMNTMFAAIAQRTKDIGVLRIIGFAPWQILVSFFVEALLLAFLGGLVGCAVGSLAHGWTATSILSAGAGGGGKSVVLKMTVDAQILIAGMIFSLMMGAIGGLFPAISAMRLKPLDAVR